MYHFYLNKYALKTQSTSYVNNSEDKLYFIEHFSLYTYTHTYTYTYKPQFESFYTSRLTTGYINRTSLEIEVIKKKKRLNLLCNLPLFVVNV